VNLVAFITRIYHDERSPERQNPFVVLTAVTVNPCGVIETYGRSGKICCLHIWDWIFGWRGGGTRSCQASNNFYHNVRRHTPDESTSLPITYVVLRRRCSQYIRHSITEVAPPPPTPTQQSLLWGPIQQRTNRPPKYSASTLMIC